MAWPPVPGLATPPYPQGWPVARILGSSVVNWPVFGSYHLFSNSWILIRSATLIVRLGELDIFSANQQIKETL